MSAYRHPSLGRIDRDRPLTFTFAGRRIAGHAGDTVASALLANGIHGVTRSFKYHRPRGILGAGSEDPAALVQLNGRGPDGLPNTRATETAAHEGLVAWPQNCWPSLALDVGALADAASRFLPAGFYYKTFMGTAGLPGWGFYEGMIRRSAGLGTAPDIAARDPDAYESVNRHCDVLVVGAGPAGIAAALAASAGGARVIVCDEADAPGGTLLGRSGRIGTIAGGRPLDWVASAGTALAAREEVTFLTRTTAAGYYSDNLVLLSQDVEGHRPPAERDPRLPRERLWRVRAGRVILATGAVERPLVFHQNDRPGVMLAGALRTFLHRWGVLAGKAPLVFTNNDTGWEAAFDLADAGARVAAIIDLRAAAGAGLAEQAASRGIPVHAACAIVGTKGRWRVSSVRVAKLSADGTRIASDPVTIACDVVGMAGGWAPNVALFSQSRGALRYDEALQAFVPARAWQDTVPVGACAGELSLRDAIAQGFAAGRDAAEAAGYPGADEPPAVEDREAPGSRPHIVPEIPSDVAPHAYRAFVDWQDDVTTKDLALAIREGFSSVEHMKRYTTTGMGTDQGKTANLNALAILAARGGVPVPEIGVTTFRQPYRPVTMGSLAGLHVHEHFAPRRTTPMHAWHREAGAIFEPVGEWLRPRAYPRPGESFAAAVAREARATRTRCGLLDASTLGKIDIRGRDARTFLDRVYPNAWDRIAPGRCRYGFLLDEEGMVMDDGVTACLADDHFHMTTTTGGAASVLQHLEDYLQTEWPELEVFLTSVTEQWAVLALSGPGSAALMEELAGPGLGPDAFPFLDWREAEVLGVPARIFRIAFTGEPVAYEINVAARYGLSLWREVVARGRRHGLTPYGTEAMHVLRAEKGFVIVGQDTDGTVTPHDLRMPWAVDPRKPDFIGKRSLTRADTGRAGRHQLVGLLTEDAQAVPMEGAQVIALQGGRGSGQEGGQGGGRGSGQTPPVPMLGHVTSAYLSPNLARSIALALIEDGGARMGETVMIARRGAAPLRARIVETDFLARHASGADAGTGAP